MSGHTDEYSNILVRTFITTSITGHYCVINTGHCCVQYVQVLAYWVLGTTSIVQVQRIIGERPHTCC